MKLYNLPRNSYFKFANPEDLEEGVDPDTLFFFEKLDGAYSRCFVNRFYEDTLFHLHACTDVVLVEKTKE